jgi:hypothetical protein
MLQQEPHDVDMSMACRVVEWCKEEIVLQINFRTMLDQQLRGSKVSELCCEV